MTQPDPTPSDSRPVWELVIEDMHARDQTGRERYGVPLQAGNGRDALRDAYEEALDLAVYLRQAIAERDFRRAEPPVPPAAVRGGGAGAAGTTGGRLLSKVKHTPGAGFVFGNGHCVGGPFTPGSGDDPKQQTAGVAMCGVRLRHPEEAEANARLVAAAPDLLAACRETLDMIERGFYDRILSPNRADIRDMKAVGAVLGPLRAAIAKAEGRQ